MWIYSSSIVKTALVLLLTLSTYCCAKKVSYKTDDYTPLLGDLTSAESEEKRNILKSLAGVSDDSNIAEESRRDRIEIIVERDGEKNDPSYRSKSANGTDKTHGVVQWYARPSRIVEQHVQGDEPDSYSNSYSNHGDSNLRNSGYDDHNDHDDHYHVDHHHIDHHHIDHHDDHPHSDENQNGYTSHHHHSNENTPDVPTSDVFYKKLKLKKVRRNCTRSKVKKIKKGQDWPGKSAINLESRSNNGIVLPHVTPQNLPAVPEARFNDVPKTLHYPAIPSVPLGFSGEHLHGIPRTHFFQYQNGEGINHYHLHNHNHIYDANGKRINIGYSPQYRNLAQNFEKLKTMLTTSDSPKPDSYSHVNNHYRSTVSLGDSESKPPAINGNDQDKSYHYNGALESYGRKPYKREYPSTKTSTSSTSTSTDDLDKSIGMEMYRYGAGQYGTDEFSSHEKEFYPNEVKYGIDKSYSNSGENYESIREKPYSDYQSSSHSGNFGNRNPYSSAESPFTSYSSDYDHSYNNRGKEDKYSQQSKEKSPFDNQDKAPYTPQEKAPYTPQEKAPYTPQDKTPYPPQNKAPYTTQDSIPFTPIDKPSYGHSSSVAGPSSAEFNDGFKGPEPDVLRNPNLYPDPYDSVDGKNGPNELSGSKPEEPSSQENLGPKSITHSVSYSQDGDIETVDLGPENLHLYKNLRPEPDPLTIPKNARIFEHYIRLHPIHYMYAAMARNPMNIPTLYGNLGYPAPLQKYPAVLPKYPPILPKYPAALPKYPVPVHKLMPNPLKMPAVLPTVPLYPRVPLVPQWNQMLAYQNTALYHRWW